MKTGQTCRPTPPASSSGSHVSREHVRLAEPVLAVRELQQQIGVGVREQPADYPFSDDRRRVHADVLRHQSRDGRGDRGGPAPRRRGDEARDRGGRACLSGLAGAPREGASADPAPLRRPDARAAGGACAPAHHRAGQAARGGASRDRLRRLVPRVVRRGGEARLRRHDPRATGGPADRRAQGADRRLRRDHALELPRRDDHAQGRAGARRRLHDRDQARRADTALGARARRARGRGRCARGRAPGRHRRRRGRARDRRRADVEPDRPQALVHRLDRDRQAADGAVRGPR